MPLDVFPEPREINFLGACQGGDKKPILPAWSAISVKSHETECHRGQEQPCSEDEQATPGLIDPIHR